jgi:hypothetical protein
MVDQVKCRIKETQNKTSILHLLYTEVLKLVEKRGRTSENRQKMGNVSDDTKMDYGLYNNAKRR